MCLGWLPLWFGGLPAHCEKISGWGGAHEFAFDVRTVPAAAVFPVAEGSAEFVALTEVYPDTPQAVSYHYLVTNLVFRTPAASNR